MRRPLRAPSSACPPGLFAALLRAIPPHAALVLVGDADQLPSVGPGRVLADVIESGAVTSVALREIFRQTAESGIVQAAHQIHAGDLPDALGAAGDAASDFFFIEANDPERAAEVVLTVVQERIPKRFGLDPASFEAMCSDVSDRLDEVLSRYE